MKSLRTLLSVLCFVSIGIEGLHAQQTFIVDKAGGPGSQFTEIQFAIAAASPGDIIKVRPVVGFGSYDGFTVDKALRIVGGPGVRVGSVGSGATGFWSMGVENLGAGAVVVLTGLEEEISNPFAVGLVIRNNLGVVHCEDVKVSAYTLIDNARQASFQNCEFLDVTIEDSQVLLTECSAAGYFDANCMCRIPALMIKEGSRVTIANGTYTGVDGGFFNLEAEAAIALQANATLFITGDFGTRIQAGAPLSVGAPAISTLGGQIVLDPDPALVPTGIQPEISGPAQVTTVRIPYFHVTMINGVLTTTVETWRGADVKLYYSPFFTPFSFLATTPDVWVGRPRIFWNGPAPANGILTGAFTMPELNLGTALPLQAVVLHEGEFYLSNPVVSLLR